MPENKIIDLDTLARFKTNCDTEYQATLVSGTNIKTINNTSLLGSGNYEFDDEFSEVSTNALQNQVISKEIRELNYELAIIREELFETVLTELDYEYAYAMSYTVPDTLSDTDGTHRVVYSETQLKALKGNSVVYNQLANKSQFASGSKDGIVVTSNTTTGEITVSGTQESGYWWWYHIQDISIPANHWVLFYVNIVQGDSNVGIRLCNNTNRGASTISLSSMIGQSNATYPINALEVTGGNTANVAVNATFNNIRIIDLTKMFPINTPTTLDDKRVQWLLSLGTIPYNTGELKNTTTTGIQVVGYNKFDGNLETGYLSNGEPVYTASARRSTNYIRVLPSTSYKLSWNSSWLLSVDEVAIVEYDANKNFIKKTGSNTNPYTLSLSANTYYIKFYFYKSGITTSTEDVRQICYNISSVSLGYKQYQITTINVPSATLKGVGTAQDYYEIVEGNVVEGEQLYNLVLHSVMETANLSTLSWTLGGANNNVFTTLSLQSTIKKQKWTEGYIVQINTKGYASDTGYNVYNAVSNNKIAVDNNGIVYLNDTSLNNDTTAITGTLVYQKATPTTTTVATDLHFDQISSIIEQGGTINALYEDVPPTPKTTFVVKKAVGE